MRILLVIKYTGDECLGIMSISNVLKKKGVSIQKSNVNLSVPL